MKVTVYEIYLQKTKACNLPEIDTISSPSSVVEVCKKVSNLGWKSEEVFTVIGVNTKNKVVGYFEMSRGTINQTLVHPREIFKPLLLCNAAGFFMIHNHPSGMCDPSKEDKQITKRLDEVGALMGIRLVDSIIMGHDSYYSFKENNEMS